MDATSRVEHYKSFLGDLRSQLVQLNNESTGEFIDGFHNLSGNQSVDGTNNMNLGLRTTV